eukprot:472090-Heterocapsa_arctica.AAC.1
MGCGDAMGSARPTTAELMQFMKTMNETMNETMNTMNETLTGDLKEVKQQLKGFDVIRGEVVQVKEDVSTLNKR